MTEEDPHLWERPTLEEVAAGVWRVPLPLPGDALRAVNTYLVRGPEGFVLVDCGWNQEQSWRGLEAALSRLGAGPTGVRWVFATHVHDDHYGLSGRMRREAGSWVSLGDRERQTLEAFRADPGQARQRSRALLEELSAGDVVLRLERAGAAGPERSAPGPPDLYLTGGETLVLGERRLEVVATPGHTRGHLCLLDRAGGLFFAGDHVLPQITPSLGVELPGDTSPLRDFLRSLQLVRDLPASLVLPAHGPVFRGLDRRVDELAEHHRLRLDECWEAVAGGARTARAVAGELPWTRHRRRFEDLDPFNQMLAVFEADAHLRVLVEQGRLASDLPHSRGYALP